MKEETGWAELGKIFFIILVIGCIFEFGLLAFAYFNADEVECNLLWCTFTKEYSSSETYTITSSNKECFVNGNPVNCSEIANEIDWASGLSSFKK